MHLWEHLGNKMESIHEAKAKQKHLNNRYPPRFYQDTPPPSEVLQSLAYPPSKT